jgi:hypothetical protein
MQRNTENMAVLSIVVISLLSVAAQAVSYKPITLTEYDGPKIVAVHVVTPGQLYESAYASFYAEKRGNKVITIERAKYEGLLTDEQYFNLGWAGIPYIEVG